MKGEKQQAFTDNSPKKHLEIPKEFVHAKRKKRVQGGGSKKSKEERDRKRAILESELSEVVEYRNEFDIFNDDAYYAEIQMEIGQINMLDQLEHALSINLLKYSNKYALIAVDLTNFDAFKEKLLKATYLDKISQISPYKDRIDKYLEESILAEGEDKQFDVEVDFFPKLSKERYRHATDAIREFLSKNDAKFDKSSVAHYGSDNIFLKMTGHDIKKIGAGVATISKICTKPEVLIEGSDLQLSNSNLTSRREFNGDVKYTVGTSSVNVIDTGIDEKNPWLSNLVTDATADYSNAENGSADTVGHGTFVSGLICHGRDNLEKGLYQPALKINMAKLTNEPRIGPERLVKLLPTIIDDFKQYSRVFNISINLRSPQPTASVMELCENVDELARMHDLIICVSAGNISAKSVKDFYRHGYPYPDYYKSFPQNVRVSPPANCCNVLSVGSFVSRGKGVEPAQDFDPSPFTRRGNSLNGILKPDVVESGGNWSIDESGRIKQPDIAAVKSLSKCNGNDSFTYGVGTSCASPLVARLAAKILDHYRDASANLVRALLVNSCRELGGRNVPTKFDIEKQKLYGFGQPLESDALNSVQYRVSLYCEDKIRMNECHFIDFYVPEELKKPRVPARLIITLAYDPPADCMFLPDKSFGGYTKVALRPYLRKRIDEANYSEVSGRDMIEGVSNWTPEYSNSTIKNAVFEWARLGFGKMWQVKIVPERHGINEDFEQKYALVITLETDHQGVQIYDRIDMEMHAEAEEMVRERAREEATASLA
jgi:hypothetical protein